MTTYKLYRGDVGVKFRATVTAEEDGTVGLTVSQFKVKTPKGTEVIWEASTYSGTQIEYTSQDGDLDTVGTYYIQSYCEWGGGSQHRGHTYAVKVYEYYK